MSPFAAKVHKGSMQAFVLEETGPDAKYLAKKKRRRSMAGAKLDYQKPL
jgi:hypothetical protein